MLSRRLFLASLLSVGLISSIPALAEEPYKTNPEIDARQDVVDAVYDGLMHTAFGEVNDVQTRSQVSQEISARLIALMKVNTITSFSLWCNDANNPPVIIDQGAIQVDVEWFEPDLVGSHFMAFRLDGEGFKSTEFKRA